ncbi:MAG: manganese efflux pump MntP family protein [Candidatus Sumerlaeota bacterium]|nr:manganese efflux pump MntP family protein [Candidatus Sumerlaeota bacterium]
MPSADTISFFPLLLIALALGCDAFSVSVGVAGPFRGQNFRIAFHFGLFQAIMPLIGWTLGYGIERYIKQWDHWVAFALLAGVGAHMIWEAFQKEKDSLPVDRSRRWSLVVLSVAVSIDALAVGIVFGVKGLRPWWPCLLIGIATGAMSLTGLYLGRRLKAKLGKIAEVAGGVVLVALAIKFLRGL